MMSNLPKNPEELAKALKVLSDSTPEAIAELVENGGYLISNKVAVEELTLPDLSGGWKLHSTTPHKLELPRIIFISATKADTRLIWNRGQHAIARNAGLSSNAIQRWLKCNSKHKYRFLDHVALAEKDSNVKDAYLNYSADFTNEQYRDWVTQYSVHDSLSPVARGQLVDVIKEILQ